MATNKETIILAFKKRKIENDYPIITRDQIYDRIRITLCFEKEKIIIWILPRADHKLDKLTDDEYIEFLLCLSGAISKLGVQAAFLRLMNREIVVQFIEGAATQ